ncbi:MAG: exodeoxyribonuclease V subunit gamma [Mariprofundaceae bacterium]|nr:exodeoxyribonuclease V subunit gamma [Mariprofundaceae bacterium]
MPLFFTHAHDLDILQTKLAKTLRDSPLPSPFMVETIVVADPAIARWLGLQLATSLGIHCNQKDVKPAACLRGIIQRAMPHAPKRDPLNCERMVWLVFSLLPCLLDEAPFSPLKDYLLDDAGGIKRWQLAKRIAHVFDRYQDYRPAWIRAWSAGEEDHWQACLWRALLTSVGKNQHRVAVIDAWLAHNENINEENSPAQRLCFFGVEKMPPLLLQSLHVVAQHRDVLIFQWQIQPSKHPLSQAWRMTDGMLSNTEQSKTDRVPSQTWPPTILGQLKKALIYQQSNTGEASPRLADASLQLHSCHSPMREVEVLHDALLSMLDADVSLQPENILVLVPEISRYMPYIAVVFAEHDSRPFIPWNISDVYIPDEHPVIEIFFQLLQLPESRFTQSEILAYLDVQEITQHFEMNDEHLFIVRTMLAQLNVRWGVDAIHRASFGLPAWAEQSWQATADRLFAGYALGDDQAWAGIAPVAIDTNTATAMAAFFALFDTLNRWRLLLNTTQTGLQWQQSLSLMLDEVFGTAEQTQGKIESIRYAVDEFSRSTGNTMVDVSLLHRCLKEKLQSNEQHPRYFSGGVSFCAMRPMRPLPFRIIALLAMHDLAFPRRDVPCEFDLMAKAPQAGDPNHSQADRYTMLQTVLSAQDILYISYCGRSIKNNTPCQPSVVVGELLEALNESIEQQKDRPSISEQMTTQHPMQPFSMENYGETSPCYNKHWANISEKIMGDSSVSTSKYWPQHRLDAEEPSNKSIKLSALIRFACDPVTFFFQQRMSIRLQAGEEQVDDEIFTLNTLQQWQVRQRIVENTMQGDRIDAGRLAAEGLLPHGAFAAGQLCKESEIVHDLQQALLPYAETTSTPQSIALSFARETGDAITVSGQLTGYYPEKGLLHYTASKYKAKPALKLWLEHLVLCAAGRYPNGEKSLLLCQDASKTIHPMPQQEACLILDGFVLAMQEGLRRPLPVFKKSSWKWADAIHRKKGTQLAQKSAETGWHTTNDAFPGDEDHPYIQLAMRGIKGVPMASPEFATLAEQWYLPLLERTVDA